MSGLDAEFVRSLSCEHQKSISQLKQKSDLFFKGYWTVHRISRKSKEPSISATQPKQCLQAHNRVHHPHSQDQPGPWDHSLKTLEIETALLPPLSILSKWPGARPPHSSHHLPPASDSYSGVGVSEQLCLEGRNSPNKWKSQVPAHQTQMDDMPSLQILLI